MKYNITKDKYIPNKKYVWCNNFCIGYFTTKVFENKNIDWQKYRSDKTLRMNPGDRWTLKFYPHAFPNEKCDVSISEETAVINIIKKHEEVFKNL
jgi:hypothetical protein